MAAISVREATDADTALILDMMEAFNVFEKIPWRRETGELALRTLLSDTRLGVVAIVEEGEATLGYLVVTWGYDLEWNGRDAFLTELFLVPEARGRGVGTLALDRAEALAARHGARALHIMVRHENEPARRLYARAGYVSPPRLFLTKVLSEPRG
jgi:ribosomal protein S18 acetylase RimI-like enzyme